MNILLIFPLNEPYDTILSANQTAWKSKLNAYKNIKKLDCAYPTGLLSIAAYLKKHRPDIQIKLLDLNAVMNRVAKRKSTLSESFEGYSFEDFLKESFSLLGDFIPDVIGVSALFCSNYRDFRPLNTFLKENYNKALVVCGGHLPSASYVRMYKDEVGFDAIAFGEGEIPLLELIEAVSSDTVGEYLAESDCWVTKEKCQSQSRFVPRDKAIVNLDEIPPFDFDILVFPDVYFNSTKYFFVIDSQESLNEIFIFSTRGCPYKCVFCASQNVHGNKVRSYSIDRIKRDILYYHEKYNIKRFVFYDDHFLIDKKRAIEILDFISQKGFMAEVPTPAFFSVTKETAAAMRRAGIKEVNITIESGNRNTLKNIMRKPGNLAKAKEAIDFLHQEGIVVVSNILIGLPGETKESIEEGLEYLLSTEIDWFQCFVVAPLPGSKLYEICETNGYLVENYDLSTMDYKKCLIKTKDFEPDYIENKAYEMNLRLNFVNNFNMRRGQYAQALKLFERLITSVIDTHAFAYYYAAICCKHLQLEEKYLLYKEKYEEMIKKFSFWENYAKKFNLGSL